MVTTSAATIHGVVLAHGSGIDDLVMLFLFPAVVTFGFWMLTRKKSRGDLEKGDDEGDSRAEPAFGSRPPIAPVAAPVNGHHPSPFHALIAPPRPPVQVRAAEAEPERERSSSAS